MAPLQDAAFLQTAAGDDVEAPPDPLNRQLPTHIRPKPSGNILTAPHRAAEECHSRNGAVISNAAKFHRSDLVDEADSLPAAQFLRQLHCPAVPQIQPQRVERPPQGCIGPRHIHIEKLHLHLWVICAVRFNFPAVLFLGDDKYRMAPGHGQGQHPADAVLTAPVGGAGIGNVQDFHCSICHNVSSPFPQW